MQNTIPHSFNPTNLLIESDEGMGSVLKLSYHDKETICLTTTTGVYSLRPDLKESPLYIASSSGGITTDTYAISLKEKISRLKAFDVRTLYHSPDENLILSGWGEMGSDWDGKGMAIVCDTSGKVYWKKETYSGWITAISWGKAYFAIGSTCGDVWIYDKAYNEIDHLVMEGNDAFAQSLCFNEEDRLIISTTDEDSQLQLLRYTPQKGYEILITERAAAESFITKEGMVAFVTDKKPISRKKEKLYVLNLHTMQEKAITIQGDLQALAFSPDNEQMVFADYMGIHTVTIKTGRKQPPLDSMTLQEIIK